LNEHFHHPLGVRDCVSNGEIAFTIQIYIDLSRRHIIC